MMAKPSDKTVHLAKSITEAIQIGRVSLLSRGYALLAVKLDLEAVMQRSVPPLKRERARDAKRPKLRLNPTHTNMTVTYQIRYTDNTLHIV